MCFGAASNGYKCITGLRAWDKQEEGAPVLSTGKKAQDIFLSAVRFLGFTAGALRWAEYFEWISLGSASPFIGFIVYPCLFITSMFNIAQEARKIAELKSKPNLDYRSWRIGIEGLRLASQVCLVALSVIGAVAMITANPALSLAVLATVFTYGFLLGIANSLEKEVNKWGSERGVGRGVRV